MSQGGSPGLLGVFYACPEVSQTGMTDPIPPVSEAPAVPAHQRHVSVSVLWVETFVAVPPSVVHNGLFGVRELCVLFFILFATEPFRLVKHLPNTHIQNPPPAIEHMSEDEVGEVPSCPRLQLFRDHPITRAWHKLVLEMQHGSRTPILALVGGAMLGKTCKCVSFFGNSKTVRVQCSGFPTGVLPAVDLEGQHAAVLWEDIRVDQLLHNRRVFAEGRVSPPGSQVFLSHGNHQVDHPPVAMMLCANFLPMTVSEGLSAEEALWMHHNVWKVTLDAGTRWWLDL